MKTLTFPLRKIVCFAFAVALGFLGATLYNSNKNSTENWLPHIGVDASATDRTGRLILATGYVAHDMEAVYCLDQLTGRLAAGVLSRKGERFQGVYERNINSDLAEALAAKGLNIPVPATPLYSLVTGELDAENRGAQTWKLAKSVVYITEANTGMVLVYTIPWQQALHGGDQPAKDLLRLWTFEQFHLAVTPAQK